ncbi:MFS transporter [Tersicoccus sp. MR15.9]|uniref:MFS transporter n=1 Tax=Tersicoccus mangrovi TaxID=3121635 RepID=UPI002FE66740
MLDASRSALTRKRILGSAFVGTTIEWYDFYLYGTAAALIFSTQFFPHGSALGGILASFATFAIAFFFRPIGGIIAGHLGDRIGRKSLLVISLLTMGVATTGIGLLPTFAVGGWFTVVAVIVLRLAQGLSAGAEWGGSALLSVEHAPAQHRGFFGSFTQIGSAAGMLLATSAFAGSRAALGEQAFLAWGWRLPFLASALLVAVGLWIRLGVKDAREFTEVREAGTTAAAPVREVLRHHWRGVLVAIGQRLVQPAIYSILTVYTLTYVTAKRGDAGSVLAAVLICSALGLISGPFWGGLSDRWGRRRISLISAALGGVLVWPYFVFLDSGPLALLPLVYILAMNGIHDAIYGPQAAWFAEQFPVHVRYSGVSLGYQIGTILSGGLTPFIAAGLLALGGNAPWLICAYISVLAVASVISAAAAADPVGDARRAGLELDADAPTDAAVTGSDPVPAGVGAAAASQTKGFTRA